MKRLGPAARQSIYALVLVLGPTIFFGVSAPNFFSSFNISTILFTVSLLLLLSIGPTVILIMGSIDFSSAGILTLAAVGVGLLIPKFGLIAVLVGLVIGLGVGFINGLVFVKAKVPSFLVTLASLLIALAFATIYTGGLAAPIKGQLNFLLPSLTPTVPTLFLWVIVIYAIVYYVMNRTEFGWTVYAVGSNERATRLMGVRVDRLRLLAFTFAGLLAGIGGILMLTYLHAASSSMVGNSFLFLSFAVIVMSGTPLSGGLGGIHRNFVGAYVLGIISNGLILIGQQAASLIILQGIAILLATIAISRGSRGSVS